jgi:hypothetical protein
MQASSVVGYYSFVSQFATIELPKDILLRLSANRNFDDIEDALLYSRLAHERAHFLQNICTTYGLWKTMILRIAGSNAFESMRMYHDTTGLPISPPFSEIIPRGETIPPGSVFFKGAAAKIFSGFTMFVDGPIAADRAIPGTTLPKTSTHPYVGQPTGEQHKLAGTEITEFLARSAEIAFLNGCRDISQSQRDSITPKIWVDWTSQVALRVSDRCFDSRTRQSWAASAAMSELALNADWPVPLLHYVVPVQWEDLHPGWRFVRMCEVIEQRKIPVPQKGKEILEFQLEICNLMKWTPPNEALRNMIIALEQTKHPLSDILPLSKKALQFFENNPQVLPWLGNTELCSLVLGGMNGPIVRGGYMPDALAVLCDVALQLFLANFVVCPLCLDSVHRDGCKMKKLIEDFTRPKEQ